MPLEVQLVLGNGQHCLDRCVAFRLPCLFMPMFFHVSVSSFLLLCRVCASLLCLHAGVKTFYNTIQKQLDPLGSRQCFFKNVVWIVFIMLGVNKLRCQRILTNIRQCFSLMMSSAPRQAGRMLLDFSSYKKKLPSSLQRKRDHTFYCEAPLCKQLSPRKLFLKE